MSNNEEDIVKKSSEIIAEAQSRILSTMPMWIRLGFLCNILINAQKNGIKEEDILWDKINNLLSQNVKEYDFNCFDKIQSYDEAFQACENSRTGQFVGPWRKERCKDCGKIFYMTFSEVEFFEGKELKIPKRCTACRKRRKERNKQ